MRAPQYSHRDRHLAEGFFILKGKPGPGMCMVKGCRNDGGKRKFSLCHKHYQHRWRMLNPKQSAFAALRDHARGRGIEFRLSYDYFCGMCDAFAMFDHNAETFGEFPSLDRVDSTKGYTEGNLRIITVSENSAKGQREKHLPAAVQEILARKRAKAKQHPALADEIVESEETCPF